MISKHFGTDGGKLIHKEGYMRFSKAAVGLALGLVLAGSVGSGEAAEIGEDDFRISQDDNVVNSLGSSSASIAYNSTDDEFLVVWSGGLLPDNESEILGQRLRGVDGSKLGDVIRISSTGPDGDTGFSTLGPDVVYNSVLNEYLIVWPAERVNDEFEIFGQRLTAEGVEVGANDFRISDMGPDGDANFDGLDTAVSFNSSDNEYLVVWEGDDDENGASNDINEIFGQRLAGDGTEIGSDFLITDIEAGTNLPAFNPDVIYDAKDERYLVVFDGEAVFPPQVTKDREVFAQFLSSSAAKIGGRIRISDVGDDGTTTFLAVGPSVALDTDKNRYLITWDGDDNVGGLIDNDAEIFGQLIDNEGAEIGNNDFRISHAGEDGVVNKTPSSSFVIYDPVAKNYLVTWDAADTKIGLAADETEIFGQRLDAEGAEIGEDDFRISAIGTDGDPAFLAFVSQVAINPKTNTALVVFEGNKDENIFEIFGQFLRDAKCGNGVVEAEGSETCDDGNLTAGDGCDASCLVEDSGGGGAGNNGGGCSLIR